MSSDLLLFYVLAVLAIGSALAMIFSRSPVNAVMLMVANFAVVAVLYLTLQATFLAAVQVLVYAGAIMVLFLFVVMLFGPSPAPLWEHLPGQRPLALIFSIILAAGLIGAVNVTTLTGQTGLVTSQALVETGNPELLGRALYERYALPFEITSVLLLIAMIGAVVLAKRDPGEHIGTTADAMMAGAERDVVAQAGAAD
jgi:NADH-quinone oxidoreductase subunit J